MSWPLHIPLPTEEATQALAARAAPLLREGDTLCLAGQIGTGKSTFARALIRALLDDPEAEVPSPTFTLVQTYAAPSLEIWHCDLYRLADAEAAQELGLDEAMGRALVLVEWPDRLGPGAAEAALSLHFSVTAGGHAVTLSGPLAWQNRLEGRL